MKLTEIELQEIHKYVGLYDFSPFIRNKTFLITGAKGIVGSGVIKLILYENTIHNTQAKIIASTRNPNNVPSYIEAEDNIAFCEFGNEAVVCGEQKIDYIIHAAAPTSNKVFKEEPVESLNTILDGVQNMLGIAKSQNARMIFLSSEEAYGAPILKEAITEDFVGAVDSLNIRSCYPLGKKVSELLCRCYYEEYGVNVSIIRPTVILGLWQPYDSVKVEAEILRCVMESKNLFMKSDGTTKKSVIYSLDALTAIFTVLFCGGAGETYNATNPDTFCSVKERAYRAFAEFNPKLSIDFAESDVSLAQGYLPTRSLLEDVTKISKLGWKPHADMSYIYKVDIERFKM